MLSLKQQKHIENLRQIRIGKRFSEEWKNNIRIARQNVPPKQKKQRVETQCLCCNKNMLVLQSGLDYGKFKYCSKKCYYNNIKNVQSQKNHWNWRGGITKLSQSRRNNIIYKQWIQFNLRKDNYQCQKCLVRGGDLEVHHVVPVSVRPDMIIDPYNGETLCKNCHKITHKDRDELLELKYTIV